MVMGNTEAETPTKPEKSSSQLQPSVHPYSEWAAMQAYYGTGVGIPPPYFNSAVVSGHAAHPYMWSPQPMIPHFGPPYPGMYPHGGGYPHPSVAFGSPLQGQGSTTSSATSDSVMVVPQSYEIPAKSSSSVKQHGLMKKLKGFDGLAVSPNNIDAKDVIAANKCPQSGGDVTDRSSDASSTQEGSGSQRKIILSEETSLDGMKEKDGLQCNIEDMAATKISLGLTLPPSDMGKATVVAPVNIAREKEFKITPISKSKTVTSPIPLPNTVPIPVRDGLTPEHWIQDERELKRERRKQSNRESARRSRLRKQAETEELALKVENLASENAALKAELSRLTDMSEKLRQENSTLMEKLEDPVGGDSLGRSCKTGAEDTPTVNVENLCSRVNNSSSNNRCEQQEEHEDTTCDNSSSNAKLHQLLEPNGRTDTVAAG